MHPSMDEFMTYPEELNKTDIFSKMSTKISFFLDLSSFMDLCTAVELMVEGVKKLNFPTDVFYKFIFKPELS